MKFFSIGIFFFCFNINLFSQDFPSEIWHKGWLVTNQKDTLNGFVKYNFENQLIQVKVDNTIKAFSNRNIYYFEIFDNTIEDYRQFYSLMYEINYNYSIPILFEVLIKGKLTLLIKEKIVSETVPRYFPSYYSYGRTYYEQYNKLEYDFFFMNSKGSIYEFNGKKNELFDFMIDNIEEIKQYYSNNNLRIKKMKDLVKIVAYYNSL